MLNKVILTGFRDYNAGISFWGLPFNPLQGVIYGKGPHFIRLSTREHEAWHTGSTPWTFVETMAAMLMQRGRESEEALVAGRKMVWVLLLSLSLTEQPPFPVMGYETRHSQVSQKRD